LLPDLMSESSTSIASPASAGSPAPAAALPEGVRLGNEQLVQLTDPAGVKVRALIAREHQGGFLRIAISGGGCNGLSYKMKFVPEPRRGDILVRTGGVEVLVDSKSALYLKGTHVDYSSARLMAFGVSMIPSCFPSGEITRTCGTLIR
jgi:iron-sulfur cluster assembly protein